MKFGRKLQIKTKLVILGGQKNDTLVGVFLCR